MKVDSEVISMMERTNEVDHLMNRIPFPRYLPPLLMVILMAMLVLIYMGGSAQGDDHGVVLESSNLNDWAEPGDEVWYTLNITNTGTVDDSYNLSFHKGSLNGSVFTWCAFQGIANNSISIPSNNTRFIDILVTVPEFTPEHDDAYPGMYDFTVLVQSTNDGEAYDTITFELEILQVHKVSCWSEVPDMSHLVYPNEDSIALFTLHVLNLGNVHDSIEITAECEHLGIDLYEDRSSGFGKRSLFTIAELDLDPLEHQTITIEATIPAGISEGEHPIWITAQSVGSGSAFSHENLTLDLNRATYDMKLQRYLRPDEVENPAINPAKEGEMEMRFLLENTGNVDDEYIVRIETPLGSGTYRHWRMEFENDNETRVDTIRVPSEIPGAIDTKLAKNELMDIKLHVNVDIDEDEGLYDDICISATSVGDPMKVRYLSFNLSVILPNIRLSDDPDDFYINPDSEIEEDDSVDINLRVYNDGNDETDKFYVVFYNGKKNSPSQQYGNAIGFETVDNIPANSYTDILVTWDGIPGGENDIYAYADKPIRTSTAKTTDPDSGAFLEDGRVHESRENDNTASIDDMFQDSIDLRPDLTILDIEFEDSRILDTEDFITLTVTIGNVGYATADINSAEVSVKAGGEPLKEKNTNIMYPRLQEEIDAGDEITMEFKWIPDGDKNYTIKAMVDHPDDISSGNDKRTEYRDHNHHIHPPPDDISYDVELLLIAAFFSIVFIILVGVAITRNKKRAMLSIPKIPKKKTPVKARILEHAHSAGPNDRSTSPSHPPQDRWHSRKSDTMSRQTPHPHPSQTSSQLPPSHSWTCPRCRSSWSSGKDMCWICGQKRPK